jgi:hypothetical protein
MRTILGVSGKRGVGKSLLAKCLTEIGWREVSFATELKKRVRHDFGLTTDQTDGSGKEKTTNYMREYYAGMGTTDHVMWTPRNIMIEYGKFFRSVDPDFWVKQAWRQIEQIPANVPVVISDVRFLNEVEFLRAYGAMVIRLERDPKLNIYKCKLNDISEVQLDNYKGFSMVVPQEANQFPEDLRFLAKRLESLREVTCAVH